MKTTSDAPATELPGTAARPSRKNVHELPARDEIYELPMSLKDEAQLTQELHHQIMREKGL